MPLSPQSVNSPSPFQANDRWAAVGDSITHSGSYHHYINLFYATRFPERRLELLNCGISGDTAARVLARLDGDVLIHRPTVATVLLGMNDAAGWLYEPGKSGPEVEAERAKALETYESDMRTLLTRIQKTGARLIVVTPTIYDETVVHPEAVTNNKGHNGALDCCAEIAKSLAAEFGAAVIDLHGPMAEWNARVQKTNPAFTLVGMDRVHPGEVGHFVMAREFLKAQGVPRFVSRMILDAQSGKARELIGARVDGITTGSDSLEFDCLESALPFPVPAACQPALEFFPFVEELNQQILQVEHLSPGTYELRIDGTVIKSYSDQQLAEGVNLAMEPATPQYQQAQAVLELAARRAELFRKLRGIAEIDWNFLHECEADRSDMKAVKAVLDEKLEKDNDKPWYEYCKGQVVAYVENKPCEQEYREQIAELTRELYRKNIPVSHRYSIRTAR